jgi:hypothetical protein
MNKRYGQRAWDYSSYGMCVCCIDWSVGRLVGVCVPRCVCVCARRRESGGVSGRDEEG